MNKSRALAITMIATLCVLFAFSIYAARSQSPETSNQVAPSPTPTTTSGIWAGTQVTIDVTKTSTQETQTIYFTSVDSMPAIAFEHTIKLLESDFENYVIVEITRPDGTTETIDFTKLDAGSIDDLNLTLTNTINSPCPDGAQC